MLEPYELWIDQYQLLPYDLQEAIDKYTAELVAHASTEGVPGPSAPTLVEVICNQHGGLFVIVPDPEPTPKRALPKDAKYYKNETDQKLIMAVALKAEMTARAQADKEAKLKDAQETLPPPPPPLPKKHK
jgi:hypothetical protein